MKKVRRGKIKIRTHKRHRAHKAHKDIRRKTVIAAGIPSKASGIARPVRPVERTKGQSALATTVAEDELEERRRLFAKARKGDKGAVAKIYELYGARIYTTAQVKEVQPGDFFMPLPQTRRRARTA
jgi:hypothetical protein